MLLGNVQHTVGNLLMRATTLLQTSSRSEACTRSYVLTKLWKSRLLEFQDSHLGVLGQISHLDVVPVERRRVYYKGEGGGFPPSLGRGESCVSGLPVARPSTKSAPTMH